MGQELTLDQIEHVLLEVSSRIADIAQTFFKQTGHHIDIHVYRDQMSNIGCDCSIEILGSSVVVQKGDEH